MRVGLVPSWRLVELVGRRGFHDRVVVSSTRTVGGGSVKEVQVALTV